MFANPTLFFDLLLAFWLTVVSVVVWVLIPLWFGGGKGVREATSAIVRVLAVNLAAAWLWSWVGLLTWVTAVFSYGVSLAWVWRSSRQRKARKIYEDYTLTSSGRQLWQYCVGLAFDIFEGGVSREVVGKISQKVRQWWQQQLKDWLPEREIEAPLLALGAFLWLFALGLSLAVRAEAPLSEWRFVVSDRYGELLSVQQILLGQKVDRPTAMALLSTISSLFAGAEPIRVVPWLGVLVGWSVTIVMGIAVTFWTRTQVVGAIAAGSLGAYLYTLPINLPDWIGKRFGEGVGAWSDRIVYALNSGFLRQWNPGNLELGIIFLLLTLCAIAPRNGHYRPGSHIDAICGSIAIAVLCPPLLWVFGIGGLALLVERQFATIAISIFLLAMGALAAAVRNSGTNLGLFSPIWIDTLPIAISLTLAAIIWVVNGWLRGLFGRWTGASIFAFFIAFALNFGWPNLPIESHLEYEISFRKAVEISQKFPFKQWTIVAPIEELSLSYRRGLHVDLASFIEKNRPSLQSPDFVIPIETPHIFVFAEKLAFGSDRPPTPVEYSTQQDPTYNFYRSPSGRQKLFKETIDWAEFYLQNHASNSKVYYQDDRVKIYQFTGQKKS
jgi:hypothetical protein